MSSITGNRTSRIRRPTDSDKPRSRFRRPKHLATRRGPRHRKAPENDLTSPRNLLRYVVIATITVLVAVGVRTYAIQMYYIPSASMYPTLCGGQGCEHGNDRILVNKLAYRFGHIERHDVVVFDRPAALNGVTSDKILVKRVIGIGGDTVKWSGATVWVNGVAQQESYVNPACAGKAVRGSPGQVVLAPNEVFLMGDNRCDSIDGRVFGPVDVSTVRGEAFAIVWPVQHIGLL